MDVVAASGTGLPSQKSEESLPGTHVVQCLSIRGRLNCSVAVRRPHSKGNACSDMHALSDIAQP